MKKSLRYAGVVILMLAFFATCLLLAILHRSPKDEFEFLSARGHVRSDLRLLERPSTGVEVPTEYRIYSWKADFNDVAPAALAELQKQGYESRSFSKTASAHKGDRILWISMGRSDMETDVFYKGPTSDSDWVTVLCTNPAPDNWSIPIKLAYAKRKAAPN